MNKWGIQVLDNGSQDVTRTQETWPNFFIVGATRAATTSLYHYLRSHPSIYMSPVKEPAFFTPYSRNRIQTKSDYLHLFDGVTDEIAIGEASPQYIGDLKSPKRIHDVIPDAKIIMILRDPIERAFSHWFMLVNDWWQETIPFTEAVESSVVETDRVKMQGYIRLGFYSDQVQIYRDTFGSDHVKVLIFEEFIHDIQGGLDDIFEFLGVEPHGSELVLEPGAYNRSIAKATPKNKIARRLFHIPKVARSILPSTFRKSVKRRISKRIEKQTIEPRDRKLLQDLYRDDVKKLSVILKRPLPWSWSR